MVFLGDAQFQTSPFRSIFWFRLTFQELIKNISHFHTLSSFSFTFSGISRMPGHPFYQRGRSIWCTCGTKFAENMVQTSKLKVSRKLARVFTKRPDAWKQLHQFHMGINSLPFHGTWPPCLHASVLGFTSCSSPIFTSCARKTSNTNGKEHHVFYISSTKPWWPIKLHNIHIRSHTYACMHVWMDGCMYACMHVCMSVCYVCVCVCVCIWIWICICIYSTIILLSYHISL